MSRFRISIGVIAGLIFAAPASAHPVPTDTHIRTITVCVRPTELCVRYRVELDQFTTVFKDSKGLIDETEVKHLNSPAAFYGEFVRRLGPILADQLDVTLDGRPITLHSIEQQFEASDHLLCDFLFQADWTLQANHDYRLRFRDRTYDGEQGRVRLGWDEDPGVTVSARDAPSSILQSRAPIDLRPGDDTRLRTLGLTFRVVQAAASAGIAAPAPAPSTDHGPHSSLLALLDAPHGFGVLMLLATLFGAAHALTPGHGKTL